VELRHRLALLDRAPEIAVDSRDPPGHLRRQRLLALWADLAAQAHLSADVTSLRPGRPGRLPLGGALAGRDRRRGKTGTGPQKGPEDHEQDEPAHGPDYTPECKLRHPGSSTADPGPRPSEEKLRPLLPLSLAIDA